MNPKTPDGAGRLRFVPPRHWAVWNRPKRVLVYILAVDAAALSLTVAALLVLPVRRSDLILCLAIMVCAIVYVEVSAPVERLRERAAGAPYMDLNTTWTWAAAVLLHPALVTLVVVGIFFHRWIRVRLRTPHKHTFSAANTIVSSFAGIAVLGVAGQYHSLADGDRTLFSFLLTAAAGVTYVLVNTVLTSLVIAMTTEKPTVRSVTGRWDDYLLELATAALAIVVAWALVDWPGVLLSIFVVAIVLHRNVLLPQLRDAARTDVKTGVLTYGAWERAAGTDVSRAERTGSTLGVLMVDLDHFKLVNDHHGHLLGDLVLMKVATAISGELRESDIVGTYDLVGRFGGEEFVVLLPNTSADGVVRVAERVRRRVAQLTVQAPGATVTVTASIGVALYPMHGATLTELVETADVAMYAAKAAGRDQVSLPPVPGD